MNIEDAIKDFYQRSKLQRRVERMKALKRKVMIKVLAWTLVAVNLTIFLWTIL